MSFSPDWLALREGPDHRSRSADLAAAFAARLSRCAKLCILDLGCGTGSNLRATAPLLPPIHQSWRLVDHDQALLAAARARLSAWADGVEEHAGSLTLIAHGKHIEVAFVEADLRAGIGPLLTPCPDIVTAAALFDLVSADWLARFAADLGGAELPLYTVLTYDGTQRWSPAMPEDGAIIDAFDVHQQTDKGFGPAAGPRAVAVLEESLQALAYAVTTAPSPWRLTDADRDLIAELAAGTASAAAETGRVTQQIAATWAKARRHATTCDIGHADLLAWPPIG
jgi:SAM-dependent methyltransferase